METKAIEGYPDYAISSCGDVTSYKRYKEGRVMKQGVGGTGYRQVRLYHDDKSKTFKAHRLLAQAFIPNPDNKAEVNHINGIKTDNRLENLEWCTDSENQQHAVATGLKKSMKHLLPMIISLRNTGMTYEAIGNALGCSQITAWKYINKR